MRKERAKGGRCARMYVGGGVGIRRKETRRGLECNRKDFSLSNSWLPLNKQSRTTAGEAYIA